MGTPDYVEREFAKRMSCEVESAKRLAMVKKLIPELIGPTMRNFPSLTGKEIGGHALATAREICAELERNGINEL